LVVVSDRHPDDYPDREFYLGFINTLIFLQGHFGLDQAEAARAVIFLETKAVAAYFIGIYLWAGLREILSLHPEEGLGVLICRAEDGAAAAMNHFLSLHKLQIEI